MPLAQLNKLGPKLFYLNNNVIHSGNQWAVSLLLSTYKTHPLIYSTT
uniref:Uncharacterized protein n=1 Tax=Moniliophthora roreri TaxID=221103 RepID=A0A0W0G314_MONRR